MATRPSTAARLLGQVAIKTLVGIEERDKALAKTQLELSRKAEAAAKAGPAEAPPPPPAADGHKGKGNAAEEAAAAAAPPADDEDALAKEQGTGSSRSAKRCSRCASRWREQEQLAPEGQLGAYTPLVLAVATNADVFFGAVAILEAVCEKKDRDRVEWSHACIVRE